MYLIHNVPYVPDMPYISTMRHVTYILQQGGLYSLRDLAVICLLFAHLSPSSLLHTVSSGKSDLNPSKKTAG